MQPLPRRPDRPRRPRRPHSPRGLRRPVAVVGALTLVLAAATGLAGSARAGTAPASSPVSAVSSAPDPDLGPNVLVFDPSMPQSEIQATVDRIADQQVDDEMGTNRYALLFKPGSYGTPEVPLIVRVGYGTEVAGLGLSPTDVTIHGHVDVYNRCFPDGAGGERCFALNNFWRALTNLTIDVKGLADCRGSGNFWAVSQAAPMRRVNVTGGNLTLMDYCSNPAFASGGFIADSKTEFVISGSQQQFYVRDSSVGGWSNGVWNQVFSGVVGAPGPCFPANNEPGGCGGPYTTLPTTPLSKEKPYLFVDAQGAWQVRVPAVRRDSSGTTWENGPTPGATIPLSRFHVARPGDSVRSINSQLARGKHLLVTPGVYDVARSIEVKRPGTVVLGLGLPVLSAQRGALVLDVADVPGVDVAGLMVDAGPVNSKLLIRVGDRHGKGGTRPGAVPTTLHDVFVRIGGPQVGKATVTLEVNSDGVLMDNLWLWRGDHGNPGTIGWTVNTADTGLVVNGDDVTATGLFVEHYQKTEVVWNGERGRVVFFQNEKPYDPPSQEAWSRAPGDPGYPAFKVSDRVKAFTMTGAGSYSFFNQGLDIYAANAFEVPKTLAPGSLTNLLTIFLDPANGKGGILNVVNGVGGSSTIANPDVPVTVVSYP